LVAVLIGGAYNAETAPITIMEKLILPNLVQAASGEKVSSLQKQSKLKWDLGSRRNFWIRLDENNKILRGTRFALSPILPVFMEVSIHNPDARLAETADKTCVE